ncbi:MULTISPECIES: BMP family protein [unclassified Nocardioides]|uniref:BMP family protein n=1 Tax=unclassified Nocardioides TaxID=2615069 RepID=UPI00114F2B1E|nr:MULTISPECIES: BMP family protein [unclassified Nocardioides]TQK69355.1 nucleoside-binding protein [Nocardioides sp. SLBN-35]WGY01345.1 BMP family protein [Nocardioides sp. QY071]
MRGLIRLLAALTAVLLVAAGCGGGDGGGSGDGKVRIAAIFSGPTTDADYNALGLEALKAAEKDGAEVSYSESVAVPDIERVLQEYVADGFNVIWTHGSQFYEATSKIAKQNPDVRFIGEFDGEPEGQPENVWVIDRNFHTVFYPLGVLATNLTKSGKVGYLGGLSLPFSYSEVHAVEQAIGDSGKDVELTPVWSGDFNDTVKAQQLTSQLISGGADVVVTSLNLGVVGAFKAVNDTDPGSAWVTVKYTDKSQNGPEHYAATVLYDFVHPLTEILADIDKGTTKGHYVIGFGQGASVDVGDNVPAEVKAEVEKAVAGISDGSIEVALDQSEVK